MDVLEPPFRNREFLQLRSRVPMDLGPLTFKALPGPFGDVPLDAVPLKPLKYEADRCLYPRVRQIVKVENEASQGRGNPWPECGSGGVPEEDDPAHVVLFERKAGDGCTDGDEVWIGALSGGQVGQV